MNTLTPLRNCTDRNVINGRLADVADASVDIVCSLDAIEHYSEHRVLIEPPEPLVLPNGVYDTVRADLTRTASRQLYDKCDIPLKYADLLDEQQPDLLNVNLNERIMHKGDLNVMLRMIDTAVFGDDPNPDEHQYAIRAILSNQYRAIDNLDVIVATIRGMQRSNIDIGDCYVSADWTNDRFRVRITVPQILVRAPELTRGYRSPFRPDGEVSPVIWAGLEITNSETGGGAATVAPRAVIEVCNNGLTRKADIVRSVHIGERIDSGVVAWSSESRHAAIELIETRMSDAVNQFCSEDYLDSLVVEMSEAKGIEVPNPTRTFEVVKQQCAFSDEEVEATMNMFTKSGDMTVFGVASAVTAMAQEVDDGDRQNELECEFWNIVNQPEVFV